MNFDFNKITDLINGKLNFWLEAIVKLLPNIFLAALVLVLGIYLARFIKRIAVKIVSKITKNVTLQNLFGSIIHFTILGVVLFTVLTILNLDKAVTSILAGAGILGLALAFAFQDIASNFMSGIFLSFRKPLKVGDIVEIKGYMGRVLEINLRDTVMQTFQGKTVIIPNKEVFQNPIENYSYLEKRRFDLELKVLLTEDLEKVHDVTLAAVSDIEALSPEDETKVYFYEIGNSAIHVSIRMWINTPEQTTYNEVGSEAIIKITKAYKTNNITIPFPIQTLDIKSNGEFNAIDFLKNNNEQKQ
ncbi:mechanosensitive ion channel family protein [Flavobacterium ardleyense]|uniref:Mechanosensitive ion channel family protein n=1 Tax=Flavobacterium ardleyense TaxID=2038737 RepID=A0ABW5ZAX0_9FLAO